MISRKHRFHGHGSLKYVYQRGQTVRGPLTSLKYVENSRHSSYRLAVVVSKKVTKSAVKRNRIRRRLYEAVRAYEGKITQPHDIVMTVFHENILDLPSGQLQRLVWAQLGQAQIIISKAPKPTASHGKI